MQKGKNKTVSSFPKHIFSIAQWSCSPIYHEILIAIVYHYMLYVSDMSFLTVRSVTSHPWNSLIIILHFRNSRYDINLSTLTNFSNTCGSHYSRSNWSYWSYYPGTNTINSMYFYLIQSIFNSEILLARKRNLYPSLALFVLFLLLPRTLSHKQACEKIGSRFQASRIPLIFLCF